MKFFVKIFIIMTVCVLSISSAYAQDSKSGGNDAWLLAGYSYTFPDSKSMEGLNGPASLTIGGDIFWFIGLEASFGGRWETQGYSNNRNEGHTTWSFDIKPYLILQPKLGIDVISLRPYIGIGPSFHVSGINSTLDLIGQSSTSDSTFDVGFSAKAGLRLQALKFLFVGVGTEYLYHQAKLNNRTYDFSGWTVGAEVGFIW